MMNTPSTTDLVTWFTPDYRPLADITLPRMREWCQRHGLFFQARTNPPEVHPPMWEKVRILRELVHLQKHVIWLDVDCYIRDLDYPPHTLWDFPGDLGFGMDENGLCAGVVIARPGGLDLLQAWEACGEMGVDSKQDQTTIRWLVKHFPAIRERVSLLPILQDPCFSCPNPFVLHAWGSRGVDVAAGWLQESACISP